MGSAAVQHLLQGAAVGLAIVVAFVPERRGMVEVAALGAAVIIALQLTANYWLYPYIVWFFPLVAVALFAGHPEHGAARSESRRRGSISNCRRASRSRSPEHAGRVAAPLHR